MIQSATTLIDFVSLYNKDDKYIIADSNDHVTEIFNDYLLSSTIIYISSLSLSLIYVNFLITLLKIPKQNMGLMRRNTTE